MKTRTHFILFTLLINSVGPADAEVLKKIYLDQKNNVHVIGVHGTHKQVTSKGNAALPKLAPDNESAAWLVSNTWTAEGDDMPGSEQLVIYREGKYTSIKCTPFIRDYWFWAGGKQIAIDCGGRRFAGREILYDLKTLKELASFDQADVPLEKRPDWSGDLQ